MMKHHSALTTLPKPAASRSLKPFIVPVIMLLAGLAILLYPVVATQWNNYRALVISQSYSLQVSGLTPEQREEIMDRAHEYNEKHVSAVHFQDPWQNHTSPTDPAFADYLHQMDTVEAMAQVLIPKIKVDLPIYHGTADEVLDRGIGHLYGSSLPVGGPSTHSVLTGHTGFTNATLFDNLTKLVVGDEFYINTVGGPLKYQVDQIKVVLPTDTKDLQIVPGEDLVTLVTCTPYGINSHRLLVRGHRVEYTPAIDEKHITPEPTLVWQWWMIAIIAVVLAALAALCIALLIYIRRGRKLTAAPISEEESLYHE